MRWTVEDLGVDHDQYFTGRSSPSNGSLVFVGVGDDFGEAFEDAAESAAQSGVDTSDVLLSEWCNINRIKLESETVNQSAHKDCEEQWYLDRYGMPKEDFEAGYIGTDDPDELFHKDHDECGLHHYAALYVSKEEE